VGYNTLGGVVKKLCRDAGIEGNFTNHSLRTTMAARGLVKGIPNKLIMEKTGLGDVRSLQQYQRPSIEYKSRNIKTFDQVSVMHTSLATTSRTNSECREVREKAEEELGSEVNKSEGDSLKFEIYFQYTFV
jgi:site-specific recombinase XerD